LWIGLSVFIVVVGGTVWAVRATNFTFPPTRPRASGGGVAAIWGGAGAARDPAASRDGAGSADWACF